MSKLPVTLAVIWLAYVGGVGTVATAGAGERSVGAVATGGLVLALIASLIALQ